MRANHNRLGLNNRVDEPENWPPIDESENWPPTDESENWPAETLFIMSAGLLRRHC